jgi:hypothetical protein
MTLLYSLNNISSLPFFMKFNSNTYHMKFSSSSQNPKISAKRFVHNKLYQNKFILIILILQIYILKVT